MITNKYVVGFAFDESKSSVLLVTKNRPEWQKGLLNGIGGKMEDGETPFGAMRRECMEETGLKLDWGYVGKMGGVNFECHIFSAFGDICQYKQIEDEILGIYAVDSLAGKKMVKNLIFLIPYCIVEDHCFLRLAY